MNVKEVSFFEEHIADLRDRYAELNGLISDPGIISDQKTWQKYVKEHARLEKIIRTYDDLRDAVVDLDEARSMIDELEDGDDSEWISLEIDNLRQTIESLREKLRRSLIPVDPRDEKDVILEIRAGAGGNEASLFAADLFRMYSYYCDSRGWDMETISSSSTDVGGVREIIASISGDGVFSELKYESGVHRVQRVPVTESGGRIHTSTSTVAVLREAEDIEVEIDPADLQIDTFQASGPGGQHVNKTESAVRITHQPTGIVVSCQDEKSQHRNRKQALKVLRARLLNKYEREQREEMSRARRQQVGTGDRSERVRTYNFPQNRVTDHRINFTLHRLEEVLNGRVDLLIGELRAREEAELLQEIVAEE